MSSGDRTARNIDRNRDEKSLVYFGNGRNSALTGPLLCKPIRRQCRGMAGSSLAGMTSDGVDFTERPTANSSQIENWAGDLATKTSFLVMYIIAGFVGNCVLVTTIGQCRRLKGNALNKLLICMAVINLLDCIVNMPLILGSVVTSKWDYGDLVCQLNSAFLQLTNIATIVALLAMTFERLLAVRSPTTTTRRRLSSVKTILLIVYIWVHSIALCIPLFTSAVSSDAFPVRYLCSISQGAPLLYICVLSIFGYLIPFTLIVVFYIFIVYMCCKEKFTEKCQMKDEPEIRVALQDCCLCAEIDMSKYVGVLFIFWCVLCGPYLVLGSVEQYRNSAEVKSSTVSFSFVYPWRLDLAFSWMHLSYPVFLPVITFCWRKEVWQKFKNFVLCHKSNLINDALPISDIGRGMNGDLSNVEAPANDIPVLFATENGLHFQTYGRRSEDEGLSDSRLELCPELESSGGSASVVVTSRKCDVYSSQLLQLDEDTSDFDSSEEPAMTVGTLSVSEEPAMTVGTLSVRIEPSCPSSNTPSLTKRSCVDDNANVDECGKEPDENFKLNGSVGTGETSEAGIPTKGDHSSNDSGRGSADDFTLQKIEMVYSVKETADDQKGEEDGCNDCNGEAKGEDGKNKRHRRKKHKYKNNGPIEAVSVGDKSKTILCDFGRPPLRLKPIAAKVETFESPPSDKLTALPHELPISPQTRTLPRSKTTTVNNISGSTGYRTNASANGGVHRTKSAQTVAQKKLVESVKSSSRHQTINGDSRTQTELLDSSNGSCTSADDKTLATAKTVPEAAKRTTTSKSKKKKYKMSLPTQHGDLQLMEMKAGASPGS